MNLIHTHTHIPIDIGIGTAVTHAHVLLADQTAIALSAIAHMIEIAMADRNEESAMRTRNQRPMPLDNLSNHGELAEGWYDPDTLKRARQNAAEYASAPIERASPTYEREDSTVAASAVHPTAEEEDDGDEDGEEYGPTVPISGFTKNFTHPGPTIPNMQDLELKRELAAEDAIAAREDSRQQYRSELRSHRQEVRHIEDEILPRAEPGTRERQLEKRREAAAANRAFADARAGSPEAAPDAELMGDSDLSTFKKEKEKEQRKKNEREIRREEIMRARAAEREERVQKYREKEQETIGWLQALAKQRFG
ncbi:Uncharacterized protein PECH_001553 [Penicillium ucsense]|uniref:Uncharacterized protein n=1 Tax=Penicillium ucsense TaxID=2839758 RepID=A0A8J8WGR9_9EURO|nr:Uncharacterized protein PECM_006651 [Penicillium ucsense]KAF7732674.1 Uncharacterized protein PECH_001553 [Penicillium ucsense]